MVQPTELVQVLKIVFIKHELHFFLTLY